MSKAKKPAGGALQIDGMKTETMVQSKGRAALKPSINGASVIHAYQGNILGNDADLQAMVEGLRDAMSDVNGGDLTRMENMLVAQATALQTMFTSLARRALNQEYMKNTETFMSLALKAQAQSRATISALVDLKYPRQATFIKQANVSHGPQQVNNGLAPCSSVAYAEELKPNQPELLEAPHGGTSLDRGTEATTARGDPAVEALGEVHGAANRRGKGQSRAQR